MVNKKEKIKRMKGITLVSLVVTIIVLIILAGVSINLTLGENGIITMAKRARENMELAKVDEERQLNELYMQMELEGLSEGISYDAIAKLIEFKREIASAITDMGIVTAETADATTMASNIRNLTVSSSADKVSYDNTNSDLTANNVQGAVDELNDSLGGLIPFIGNNKITLDTNITEYTATQDGWINVIGQGKGTSGSNRIIDLTLDNGFSTRYMYNSSNDTKAGMKLSLPMRKGQIVSISSLEATIQSITFYY